MVQELFKSLLDAVGDGNPAVGSRLKKWIEKTGLPVVAHKGSASHSEIISFYRIRTECVVLGDQVGVVETETSASITISLAGAGTSNAFQMTNHLR